MHSDSFMPQSEAEGWTKGVPCLFPIHLPALLLPGTIAPEARAQALLVRSLLPPALVKKEEDVHEEDNERHGTGGPEAQGSLTHQPQGNWRSACIRLRCSRVRHNTSAKLPSTAHSNWRPEGAIR